MNYWEIIADNLSKAGWSWGCISSDGLQRANNFGLWPQSAATLDALLCMRIKS